MSGSTVEIVERSTVTDQRAQLPVDAIGKLGARSRLDAIRIAEDAGLAVAPEHGRARMVTDR